MANELRAPYEGRSLNDLHERADALVTTYSYQKPDQGKLTTKKANIRLAAGELIKGQIQIVKKNGGENNLHYHTNAETFWWVIKGKVRFYGPGDVVIGEFNEGEGIITPRYSRYWFENAGQGDDDLELMQIAASDTVGNKSGRTDIAPRPDHKGGVFIQMPSKSVAAE